MRPTDEGSQGTAADYQLVSVVNTFRVNANNTTTPLVEITARSVQYDVQFTWDILQSTFNGEGGPAAAALKTEQVNQICGHDHVYSFRTEQDQDASGVLYNYAVVQVGTDDGSITTDVRIRMDSIGLPSAFAALDAAWTKLVALGAA